MNKKILVVEDEPVMANLVYEMLLEIGYSDVTFAYNYDQAAIKLQIVQYDLVLLDINLGGEKDGIDLALELKRRTSKCNIVFITSNSDSETIKRLKKTEPDGVLIKPLRINDLMVLLEVVFYKQNRIDDQSKKSGMNFTNLSSREKEVLREIAHGYSNKMIASRLSTSPRTVSVHRTSLLKKCDAKNTADLIRLVMISGII